MILSLLYAVFSIIYFKIFIAIYLYLLAFSILYGNIVKKLIWFLILLFCSWVSPISACVHRSMGFHGRYFFTAVVYIFRVYYCSFVFTMPPLSIWNCRIHSLIIIILVWWHCQSGMSGLGLARAQPQYARPLIERLFRRAPISYILWLFCHRKLFWVPGSFAVDSVLILCAPSLDEP